MSSALLFEQPFIFAVFLFLLFSFSSRPLVFALLKKSETWANYSFLPNEQFNPLLGRIEVGRGRQVRVSRL